jgi:hypothetical protein
MMVALSILLSNMPLSNLIMVDEFFNYLLKVCRQGEQNHTI